MSKRPALALVLGLIASCAPAVGPAGQSTPSPPAALQRNSDDIFSSFHCPVTSTRDSSGVITSAGDLGLIEVRAATFPGEKLMVLVRRGSSLTDTLELRAEAIAPPARGMVMWSTPATQRTTARGSVVFEVNTKPIGNAGCWRLVPNDRLTTDPGIVVDLGG